MKIRRYHMNICTYMYIRLLQNKVIVAQKNHICGVCLCVCVYTHRHMVMVDSVIARCPVRLHEVIACGRGRERE
jgi:hypothetical protein